MDELKAGRIYEAISDVMAEIGAISKEKKNLQQGFLYRGIDDVYNALQPALVKHKVFVTPFVQNEFREERTNKNGTLIFYTRLEVLYRFYTVDGSFVETKVIGEAMDSGDKATNKALSIAYKYACFQVFCIPTEELVDPDKESHDPALRNDKQGKEGKTKAGPALSSVKPEEKPSVASGPPTPTEEQMAELANRKIDAVKIAVLRKEMERTGVTEKAVCDKYEIEKLEDCTEAIFTRATKAFRITKTKGEK